MTLFSADRRWWLFLIATRTIGALVGAGMLAANDALGTTLVVPWAVVVALGSAWTLRTPRLGSLVVEDEGTLVLGLDHLSGRTHVRIPLDAIDVLAVRPLTWRLDVKAGVQALSVRLPGSARGAVARAVRYANNARSPSREVPTSHPYRAEIRTTHAGKVLTLRPLYDPFPTAILLVAAAAMAAVLLVGFTTLALVSRELWPVLLGLLAAGFVGVTSAVGTGLLPMGLVELVVRVEGAQAVIVARRTLARPVTWRIPLADVVRIERFGDELHVEQPDRTIRIPLPERSQATLTALHDLLAEHTAAARRLAGEVPADLRGLVEAAGRGPEEAARDPGEQRERRDRAEHDPPRGVRPAVPGVQTDRERQ